MNIIELHRDFSVRYPYVPLTKGASENVCGQADYIAPEKAWELVVALLREWKSQAIMLTYEKDNPSRFNREARFLLLPMWENECISIKEVFFSGKPIFFTDLTNGGSALFCLSEYEDQAESFELLLFGYGSHRDLAEKAQQLNGIIELFIQK